MTRETVAKCPRLQNRTAAVDEPTVEEYHSGVNFTLTTKVEGTGFFSVINAGPIDETGTWYRQGNTLTLTSDNSGGIFTDDGEIIVLKK